MPCPSFLLQKASKAIAFFVRKVVKAFKLLALHTVLVHTDSVAASVASAVAAVVASELLSTE